jgi:uncharacterized protein YeaO (DUF488 family)
MSDRTSCKTEDFLDNDTAIRGQNFVCLSFISPEDVIVKKESHFFSLFTAHFSNDVKELFTNLKDKFKDDTGLVDMFTNLQDRYGYMFDVKQLDEEFNAFKSKNSEELETAYLESNKFQTTIRGIKVRGSYESMAEAQKRAEVLKKNDGKFDVYVAEVGCWCPWSPNPNEIKDQEYGETELNTLMKKYNTNLDDKDAFYRERAAELQKKARAQATVVTDVDDESLVPGISLVSVDDDPWLQKKLADEKTEVIE